VLIGKVGEFEVCVLDERIEIATGGLLVAVFF
jgi:hypothetical protein